MAAEFLDQGKQLNEAEKTQQEKMAKIENMQSRLEKVHPDYRSKFAELKEAYKAKEKWRLNEMVVSHSNKSKEYEQQLQALQEQLMLATAWHYAEIMQKEEDLKAKFEIQKSELRREMEWEQAKWVSAVQNDMLSVQKALVVACQECQQVDVDCHQYQKLACQAKANAEPQHEALEQKITKYEFQNSLPAKEILEAQQQNEWVAAQLLPRTLEYRTCWANCLRGNPTWCWVLAVACCLGIIVINHQPQRSDQQQLTTSDHHINTQ